jgi:hypothetical protein
MSELKTVKVEKDTWILELPKEICDKEGFAVGNLASLTVKDGAISGTFIHPSRKAKESAEKFINKFGDFMEIKNFVDSVINEEKDYFDEMKRLGD